ncbi:hypothetical protein [Massilibacteroides sp.]|uniref:hypothetical protein n=1 Tax=Massilibacteroides sp. TaxID=2034766 RepID=UPI00262F4827|nr:hypothetical protein [Massilibacteroides sp.]MDD4516718.1 hypothetical protein [Massilibacteroides sp.]
MDNLGDWLYIVFLIIAAVSGLFNSKKKKKRVPAKPVQPQVNPNTSSNTEEEKGFWEILQEMQNGPKQPPKPTVKNVPAKKTATKKTAVQQPFLSAESRIPSSVNRQNESILLEETDETDHNISSDDFHLQDVDEVRKAIIYSEILNRKYV